MKVVGLDLAGMDENDTGFCLFITPDQDNPLGKCETKLLHSDMDILKEIEDARPDCIAIDAPLWVPKQGKIAMPWRRSEELLMKRGFRPVSTTIPTMNMLAMRAIHLLSVLRERKFRVIEVFSQASEKIFRLSKEPRKNKDEYDALICALTAKAYLEGRYEDLDGIIIPKE